MAKQHARRWLSAPTASPFSCATASRTESPPNNTSPLVSMRLARRPAPRKKKGAIAALAAILMVPLFGFLAFSVDVGYLATEKAKLQAAADACALAAVHELPSKTGVDLVAQHYAELNHSAASQLEITTEAGNWDQDTRTFAPTSYLSNANSVRVTLTRKNTRLFFAPVIGTSHAEVVASAIALKDGDCFDKGILAGDMVIIGQDARLNDYCVYGRNGVSLGQDAHVTNGAKVGALDKSKVTYGQNPIGLPENIVQADKKPEIANKVLQVFDDLKNGVNLPPQIKTIKHYKSASHLPASVSPGTAYLFDESISIDQDYYVKDVIIATKKNISWGQNGKIRNSGSTDGTGYAIGVYAGESISLGQDSVADGVNIVGGKDVTIGQDIKTFSGTVQSAQKVIVGQDPQLNGDWKDAMPQENAKSVSFLVQ